MYYILMTNHQHDIDFAFYGRDMSNELKEDAEFKKKNRPDGRGSWNVYQFKVDGDTIEHDMDRDYYDEMDTLKQIMNTIKFSDFNPDNYRSKIVSSETIRSLSIDWDSFLSSMIRSSKNNSTINDYATEYRQPMSLRTFSKNEEILYLAYLFKQNFNTVWFQTLNYERSGEALNALLGDLRKIARIAISNKIYVEEFRDKYYGVSSEDFEDRIRFFKELDELTEGSSFIIANYFATMDGNYNIEDVKKMMNRFENMQEKEILNLYREFDERLIIELYNNKDRALVNYASDKFKRIENIKSYNGGDGYYYTSFIIDQDLVKELMEDPLIPLYIHSSSGINRGYEFSNDDTRLKIEINTSHGPFNYLEEMFLRFVGFAY